MVRRIKSKCSDRDKEDEYILNYLIDEAEKSNDLWGLSGYDLLEKYLHKAIKLARRAEGDKEKLDDMWMGLKKELNRTEIDK